MCCKTQIQIYLQSPLEQQYSAATPMQKMLPTLSARSFAAAAAAAAATALLNKLPANARYAASLNSFKKAIKTFLFNESLLIFFFFYFSSIQYCV